jgi:TolB-like protein/DNA-binding winged helix-turn-helix (wHTH) protein/Tfp pilus assembly protein PilF
MSSPEDIRFDGWVLRRRPLELFRGEHRVRLQNQPLRVLEELLTRPGELVTREQLVARLWPKRVVDFDSSLNAAVRRLRAAMEDEAETPKYIETVPRQGYRFIGTIGPVSSAAHTQSNSHVESAPPAEAPSRRGLYLAVAAVIFVALIGAALWRTWDREPASSRRAEKSIVVLPFADLSPERDQEYFADGLTEELLNSLAQSKDLRVIARTSAFSFKGQSVDIPTLAERLNVTHVLEGSVRKSGDRLRITAQLVDAANSLHLWSETYDRRLDDVLDVQSDIANAVAKALEVALSPRQSPGATVDPHAYEQYLRANFFFQRRAPGDIDRAKEYYQQALEADPRFARAWAGLAGVFRIQTYEGALDYEQGLEQLRSAADRALALDPDLPDAHLRLSHYYYARGDHETGTKHFRRAESLSPNHPLLLGNLAGYMAEEERWDEALELQRRAVAADPLSFTSQDNLTSMLLMAGRVEEARVEAAKARELEPTQIAETSVRLLIVERRFAEALELALTWPEGAEKVQALALAYVGLGRKPEADAALASLISSYGAVEPFRVAEVYAFRRETDAAFEWLRTVDRLPLLRRPSLIRFSPLLKSLHEDARWQAWVAADSP